MSQFPAVVKINSHTLLHTLSLSHTLSHTHTRLSADVKYCLPHQVAAVSIRAVLSGASDSDIDQCQTTEGQQSPFIRFLTDEILEATSFEPGCTFLSVQLSSCVTRSKLLIQ